jgi:hypothetical protein
MRLVTATTLALAGALTIAQVHAQMGGMQETAHKVANGGIRGAGWHGHPDKGTGVTNDASLDAKGSDIEIHTGPAMLYWNDNDKGTGDYTVTATFDEPKYMSSNDHPHPYGVFIGGKDLDSDNASALYCAAYGSGTFIVRGFGPAAFAIGGRRPTPNDSVHKAAGKGEAVSQTVSMSVKGDNVSCSINGTVVATYPKSDVVGAGKLSATDGFAGIRVAHNVDVNVKDFKVTK